MWAIGSKGAARRRPVDLKAAVPEASGGSLAVIVVSAVGSALPVPVLKIIFAFET